MNHLTNPFSLGDEGDDEKEMDPGRFAGINLSPRRRKGHQSLRATSQKDMEEINKNDVGQYSDNDADHEDNAAKEGYHKMTGNRKGKTFFAAPCTEPCRPAAQPMLTGGTAISTHQCGTDMTLPETGKQYGPIGDNSRYHPQSCVGTAATFGAGPTEGITATCGPKPMWTSEDDFVQAGGYSNAFEKAGLSDEEAHNDGDIDSSTGGFTHRSDNAFSRRQTEHGEAFNDHPAGTYHEQSGRKDSTASARPLQWYEEHERLAAEDGRGDWPSSSSSEADPDAEEDSQDERIGRIERQVFYPRNKNAINKAHPRLNDNLRNLQQERAVRWQVMVAAGIVNADDPCRNSFLAGEIDYGNPAFRAGIDGSSRRDATSNNAVAARYARLMAEDEETIRTTREGYASGRKMQQSPTRTLRVVNGSPEGSSSDEPKNKSKGKAKSFDTSTQVDKALAGTASHTLSYSARDGSNMTGSGLSGGVDQISRIPAQEIVPMDHWNAEAKRIGMPLTGYPTNPLADYEFEDHMMEAIHRNQFITSADRSLLGSEDTTIANGGSKEKQRRPSLKEVLRRPFARSAHKKSGSYLNRLFRRGGNVEDKNEESRDTNSGPRAFKDRSEDNLRDVDAILPSMHWPNYSEPSGFLANPYTHPASGSDQRAGRSGHQQAAPRRKSPDKRMTFRGHIEKYD